MPTVKGISGPYRFFFYSFDCDEPEQVHASREKSTCKFWISPISLVANSGFTPRELNSIRITVEANTKIILEGWNEHCD